jgi:hypothetical protein
MNTFRLYAFSFVLIIGCCSSIPKQTVPKVSIQSIGYNKVIVGNGGGFSGMYSGFLMASNGNVYSWNSFSGEPDSLELLFHTIPDSVNFFFRYLDEIKFDTISFNSFGNMNYFVEGRSENKNHRVQWAVDKSISPPWEVKVFYSMVRNYIDRH